ncbi:MAG: hypothetical protein V3T83_22460 [Acidobacteriota bacterium]
MKWQILSGIFLLFPALMIVPDGNLQAQVRLDQVVEMKPIHRFRALEQLLVEMEAEFQLREEQRRQKQLDRQAQNTAQGS